MRVYLIGYMGSGKTTVGKSLAKALQYDFIDLDEYFEEKYKISVSDFFARYDEIAFRKIESRIINESKEWSNVVVSTGGGAPCFFDNMQQMNINGITVYLKMSFAALKNRLQNAKRQRPLISGKTDEELEQFIAENLSKREPFYNQAKIIFEGIDCNVDLLKKSILNHPSFQ